MDPENRHFETHKNHAQREIVIRYSPRSIKRFFNFLFILALLGVITYQFYYPHCSFCSSCGSADLITGAAVADADNDDSLVSDQVGVVGESGEVSGEIDESSEADVLVNDTDIAVVDEVDDSDVADSSDDSLLEVTGQVGLEIDDINFVVKGDDYARVMSVKFTVKNQLDRDLTPEVRAYLTHDLDDMKEVALDTIASGEQVTILESKFTFGYNGIDSPKSVKLELFDEKSKLLKSATKSFSTK